jgi:TonB family protein
MPELTRRPAIDASVSPPKYPEAAARHGESGITTLESCITIEGRMVDVKLARSSGSVTLDSATLAWAQTAKMTPAEFNDQPMAVCGWQLDYEWRMAER